MSNAGSSSVTNQVSKQKHANSPKRQLRNTLSLLPTVPERVVLNYTITKNENEGYGITIVGGLGSVSEDVYVKSISPLGVCARDGNLRVGDQLLEVNGESMMDKSHEEVVDIFRRSSKSVSVVLSRFIESQSQRAESPVSPYHGRLLARCRSNGFDEEPTILEHKSLLP